MFIFTHKPLSIIFGWDIISSFLAGAHDIDRHFVESSPRRNLPIMLALVDFWNDAFLNSHGRVVSACLGAMELYPRFVSVLESRVLNSAQPSSPPSTSSSWLGNPSMTTKLYSKGKQVGRKEGPSPVIDGGSRSMNNIVRGNLNNNLSSEFIMSFDSPTTSAYPGSSLNVMQRAHQKRICTLLANADLLAFGAGGGCSRTNSNAANVYATISGYDHTPSSPPMIQTVDSMLSQSSTIGVFGNSKSLTTSSSSLGGNQPSTLLFCRTCDAYTCGQLIALAEHRATVTAWLWNIDPFTIMKLSTRKERHELMSERLRQMDQVLSSDGETAREENGSVQYGGMHSTTKFVLREYADRIS